MELLTSYSYNDKETEWNLNEQGSFKRNNEKSIQLQSESSIIRQSEDHYMYLNSPIKIGLLLE